MKATILLFAATVHGFWRMSCSNIQAGRLDPIINPGTVSGHSHIIAGPMNFNISSTYDSLSASFCTSCSIQDDKSAYWTPMLYYQTAAGTFKSVRNDGTVVYYLGRGQNVNNTVPFPKGFRMLSGDPFARSYIKNVTTYGDSQNPSRPVSDRVSFVCLGANYQNSTQTDGMTYTNCPNGLRAQIHFPSCWDGVNLYKSDQSHVAFLSQIDNGVCPPTHQTRIPHLFYELYYWPNEIDTSDGGKFVWAQGDPTGFGFHGDFLNGWNLNVLQSAIGSCLVGNVNGVVEDCPAFTSNDENTAQDCPEQPSYFNETVRGTLPTLPGCNPVQPGLSRATPVPCSKPVPAVNSIKNLDGQKRSQLSQIGNATYVGCFAEVNGRALNKASLADDGMTTEMCNSYCSSQGWNVFGTEYARECWCGNAIPTTNVSQSDCSMACKGNLTQYCGAGNRLSVWKVTSTIPSSTTLSSTAVKTSSTTSSASSTIVPPAGSTYLGCYTDTVSPRSLNGSSISNNSMTYGMCAQYASSNNFQYFGVEYSKECYAGNNLTSSTSSNCNMPCGGDTTKVCGGQGAMNVFKNTAYVKASAPANVTVGSVTYSYKYCLTEGTNGRAINAASFTSDGLTIEKCLQYCATGNYTFAAVEWSKECYCNNIGPTNGATQAVESDCNLPCAGNKQQLCGGTGRLGLYKKR